MPDQPTEETPQQIVERELRAAQEQVRRVSEQLRAALADDEPQAESENGTKDEH
ncbi:hypothetical protein [Kribbella sp. NPDC004536]|uniref:hypothetical protein n=1 Tax=Kribbella sp. NPDC004536 TaxID=3364106 RepID=UPI0036CFCDE8